MPWPTHAEFLAHLQDDMSVHAETNTSLQTILSEVRKGNEDTAALRTAFAPLQPISADLVKAVDERKFRMKLAGLVITLGKGIGWMAAIVAAVYAVAAVDPGFAAWLKQLL